MDLLSNLLNNVFSAQVPENNELSEFDDSGPLAQFSAFMQADSEPEQDVHGGNSFPAGGNILPSELNSPSPEVSRTADLVPETATVNSTNRSERRLTLPVNILGSNDSSIEIPDVPEQADLAVRSRPAVVQNDEPPESGTDTRVVNPVNTGLVLNSEVSEILNISAEYRAPLQSAFPINRAIEGVSTIPASTVTTVPVVDDSESFASSSAVQANDLRIAVSTSDLVLSSQASGPGPVPSQLSNFSAEPSGEPPIATDRLVRTSADNHVQGRSPLISIQQPEATESRPVAENSLRASVPEAIATQRSSIPSEPITRVTSSVVSAQINPALNNVTVSNTPTRLSEPLVVDTSSRFEAVIESGDSRAAESRSMALQVGELVPVKHAEPIRQEDSSGQLRDPETLRSASGIESTLATAPTRRSHTNTAVIPTVELQVQITPESAPPAAPVIKGAEPTNSAAMIDVGRPVAPEQIEKSLSSLGSFERWIGQLRPQVSVAPGPDPSLTSETKLQTPNIAPLSSGWSQRSVASDRVTSKDAALEVRSVSAPRHEISAEPQIKPRISSNLSFTALSGSSTATGPSSTDAVFFPTNRTGASNLPDQLVSNSTGREFVAVPGPTLGPAISNIVAPSGAVPTVQVSAQPTLSINDPDFSLQFSGQALMAAKAGLQKAEIRLNPASLGSIRVEIELSERGASVQFQVNNAAAKEAVELSMPKLREMFDASGLKLNDSQVGQQQDRAGNSQKGQHDRQFADNDSQSEGPVAEKLDSDQQAARSLGRTQNGQIDTFV